MAPDLDIPYTFCLPDDFGEWNLDDGRKLVQPEYEGVAQLLDAEGKCVALYGTPIFQRYEDWDRPLGVVTKEDYPLENWLRKKAKQEAQG